MKSYILHHCQEHIFHTHIDPQAFSVTSTSEQVVDRTRASALILGVIGETAFPIL